MSAAEFYFGMNDPRLKPRMLRSLIRNHLPEGNRPFPTSPELASVLSLVKAQELLSERHLDPNPNQKVTEAWRSAVDEWVDRLISLISSNLPDKCWAGICLLGVTCESCSSQRFLASYSLWFQKLLLHIQMPSGAHFVKVASCASLADLLTRLACFPNVKKDATSLAGKLIQPILNLLNEDGADAIWEGAIDLLCIIMALFASSVQRHYDNVEAVLFSKIMLAKSNVCMCKKFACCLSLLPKVKGGEDSWSSLMQKILISIHGLLNNAFQGLEEEAKNSQIMRLIVPPGTEPPPPLGGQSMLEASEQAKQMFPGMVIPQVSSLMHSCCMMLSNPYPVQVTIPIHNLLALVGRVLHVDGSLHASLLPFTTTMHQELLCTELPTLHLDSLDLLIAVVKGVRSQLLPHAASVVRLLTDYFKKAALPSIRIKVYFIMQILLISLGVGMALYLAQEVVNNAFADLSDSHVSGATSSNTFLSNSTSVAMQQGSDIKRNYASGSPTDQLNGVTVEARTLDSKVPTPLSVKIAALKSLEALLTVAGSLRSECWRSDVDSLLINVATNACHMGWASEGKHFKLGYDSPLCTADFQLASLEALLASLLSPAHVRPPYLSQGLELFRRGKQETGTKLAAFCAHALLALEILIHPRALPLVNASVAKGSAFDGGFGNKHQKTSMSSLPRGDVRSTNDPEDEEEEDLIKTWLGDEHALDVYNGTDHVENHDHSLRGSAEEAAVEKNSVYEQVRAAVGAEESQDRDKMHIADVDMVSTDIEVTASDAIPIASMRDVRLAGGSSDSFSTDKMQPVNSNSDVNTDMGNYFPLFKKREIPAHDSDSSSMNSLPDIVDGDPDSDD